MRKCRTEALDVDIIVSGLLTTSSYPAMYSGYGNEPEGFASAGPMKSIRGSQSAFRLANTVTFLAPVVSIVVGTFTALALQKFATVSSAQAQVLTRRSQALVYLGYNLAVYAFFTSLAAALLAVGLSAYGMFVNANSNWVGPVAVWMLLGASLILIFVGMLVTTIETTPAPQSGVAAQTGVRADTSAIPARPLVDPAPVKGDVSPAAASSPPEIQAMEAPSPKRSSQPVPLMSADTGNLVGERDQSSPERAQLQLQVLQQQLQAHHETVAVMKQLCRRRVRRGVNAQAVRSCRLPS